MGEGGWVCRSNSLVCVCVCVQRAGGGRLGVQQQLVWGVFFWGGLGVRHTREGGEGGEG